MWFIHKSGEEILVVEEAGRKSPKKEYINSNGFLTQAPDTEAYMLTTLMYTPPTHFSLTNTYQQTNQSKLQYSAVPHVPSVILLLLVLTDERQRK